MPKVSLFSVIYIHLIVFTISTYYGSIKPVTLQHEKENTLALVSVRCVKVTKANVGPNRWAKLVHPNSTVSTMHIKSTLYAGLIISLTGVM